jgi:hypothetical protein
MKKYYFIVLFLLLSTPLFANASWWNPIDWFSFIFKPHVQVVEKIVYITATTTPSVATTTASSTPTIQKPPDTFEVVRVRINCISKKLILIC